MKKMLLLLLASTMLLVSCSNQPSDNMTDEPTQPTLPDSISSDSLPEYKIHPLAQTMFDNSSEKISFDDIIQSISDCNMTAALIADSRTDAKISTGDDVYYSVKPNFNRDVKISPLDTFIEILDSCEYVETDSLNEPVIYTFMFSAVDISGEKNDICVYVTRSCVKFEYNGVSNGKEYLNMSENDSYINVCYGYDFYINGIIPDENGQLATIW